MNTHNENMAEFDIDIFPAVQMIPEEHPFAFGDFYGLVKDGDIVADKIIRKTSFVE